MYCETSLMFPLNLPTQALFAPPHPRISTVYVYPHPRISTVYSGDAWVRRSKEALFAIENRGTEAYILPIGMEQYGVICDRNRACRLQARVKR
jgi:hypothetical protein